MPLPSKRSASARTPKTSSEAGPPPKRRRPSSDVDSVPMQAYNAQPGSTTHSGVLGHEMTTSLKTSEDGKPPFYQCIEDTDLKIDSRIAELKPLAGPVATVIVGEGPQARRFTVHEGLLSHHCQFFRAAFRGPFMESNTLETHVTEAIPHVFHLFVQWLYNPARAYAAYPDHEGDFFVAYGDDFRRIDVDDLLRLQRLADFLQCPALTEYIDITIDREREQFTKGEGPPTGASMQYLYEHTKQGDPLRGVAVNRLIISGRATRIGNLNDYPAEFWYDVACREGEEVEQLRRSFRSPREKVDRVVDLSFARSGP